MVWFNESSAPSSVMTELVPAKSGKGWILKGVHFDIFLWSSSKQLGFLLEACVQWGKEGQAPQIVAVVDSGVKDGYRLEANHEPSSLVPFTGSQTGFTWGVTQDETNPFLNPPQSLTGGTGHKSSKK